MEKLNLYQRINKVMSELSYIKKGGTISMGKGSYKAVLHDDVTAALHPLCVKHGLILMPEMIDTEVSRYKVVNSYGKESERYETKTTAKVTFINMDNPEERIFTTAMAHGFDPGDKSPGKAYSMAVKYCYLKAFMLESGDDEESRVEENVMIKTEEIRLKQQLSGLLKANNKYNEASISYMNTLDIDGLRGAILKYTKLGEE